MSQSVVDIKWSLNNSFVFDVIEITLRMSGWMLVWTPSGTAVRSCSSWSCGHFLFLTFLQKSSWIMKVPSFSTFLWSSETGPLPPEAEEDPSQRETWAGMNLQVPQSLRHPAGSSDAAWSLDWYSISNERPHFHCGGRRAASAAALLQAIREPAADLDEREHVHVLMH